MSKSEILVFSSHYQPYELWRDAIERHATDVSVLSESDIGDASRVKYALVSKPRDQFFSKFTNLEFIVNMGAGVDALVSRSDLPDVAVTRIVDDGMSALMQQYVRFAVLRYARDFDVFERAQLEKRWLNAWPKEAHEIKVGVLGLGELGVDCAMMLAAEGFDTRGWSRSPKVVKGVKTFAAQEHLASFLGELDILVLLLPLHAETVGFIDGQLLKCLPKGAKVINAARGAIVNEPDLVECLRSEHLGGATLDTFVQEPLPQDHPLWQLPNVLITPHIAARPVAETAAIEIAENIRRARAGMDLLHFVPRPQALVER